MVLPYTNLIDPHKPIAAGEIKKMQKTHVRSLLSSSSSTDFSGDLFVNPNFLNERNRSIIKRFGDKIKHIDDERGAGGYDSVGGYAPHLTGTRHG